jgi:hypothetical protein
MHSHMKWKCVGIEGRHSHDSQVEIHFGFWDAMYIWINIWGPNFVQIGFLWTIGKVFE